ncbi:MAG: EthD domain-containing protein [Actinomycetota bacterium]
MTHEHYEQWWLNEHVPLAKQLPGLHAATFNVVQNPAAGEPDGITELWFDSRADFDAAYATDRWLSLRSGRQGGCSRRRYGAVRGT